MKGLILDINTFYRLFCFFKLFPMVSKGLTTAPDIRSFSIDLHRGGWYSIQLGTEPCGP